MMSSQKCQILDPPPRPLYITVTLFFSIPPLPNVTRQIVTHLFLDQRP